MTGLGGQATAPRSGGCYTGLVGRAPTHAHVPQPAVQVWAVAEGATMALPQLVELLDVEDDT